LAGIDQTIAESRGVDGEGGGIGGIGEIKEVLAYLLIFYFLNWSFNCSGFLFE
jgi:hypothetical protein